MMTRYLSTIGLSRYWLAENIHLWLRPLAVVSVLLLSVALPLQASPLLLMLLLGLIITIGGLLLITHWPPLGLFALVAGGMLIPFSGPGGVNISLVIVAALIGLWVLDMILRQRQIRLVSSRTMLPLLVFMVVAIISFGVGQLPWYTFARAAAMDAQIGGLAIFLLSAGLFILVTHQVRHLEWIKWLTWLFLGLAGFILVARVLRLAFIIRTLINPKVAGSLFWTWLVALAFSQALFNRRLHIIWRLALGALVLITLYDAAIVNRDWKSGWVPALAAIAVIIAARSWRVGLAMGLVGALPALYLVSDAIASDAYSYSTRLDAWFTLAEIIKANPLWGLGFANYYWYTPLFPINGYAVEFNSHNNYVDIIAQVGLVGLVCFLWVAWEIGWLGWRLRAQVPDGFARAYVYGALGGLAGTLVAGMLGDWVLPFVYNVGLDGFRASMIGWLFLGGLGAMEQMYMARK